MSENNSGGLNDPGRSNTGSVGAGGVNSGSNSSNQGSNYNTGSSGTGGLNTPYGITPYSVPRRDQTLQDRQYGTVGSGMVGSNTGSGGGGGSWRGTTTMARPAAGWTTDPTGNFIYENSNINPAPPTTMLTDPNPDPSARGWTQYPGATGKDQSSIPGHIPNHARGGRIRGYAAGGNMGGGDYTGGGPYVGPRGMTNGGGYARGGDIGGHVSRIFGARPRYDSGGGYDGDYDTGRATRYQQRAMRDNRSFNAPGGGHDGAPNQDGRFSGYAKGEGNSGGEGPQPQPNFGFTGGGRTESEHGGSGAGFGYNAPSNNRWLGTDPSGANSLPRRPNPRYVAPHGTGGGGGGMGTWEPTGQGVTPGGTPRNDYF